MLTMTLSAVHTPTARKKKCEVLVYDLVIAYSKKRGKKIIDAIGHRQTRRRSVRVVSRHTICRKTVYLALVVLFSFLFFSHLFRGNGYDGINVCIDAQMSSSR